MCIFVSDCHARVDIIACHCKTFRDESRTLNLKHNSFCQQRSSLRWRTRYRSQLLTAMLRMLQMHERRKWSKKTRTKAKVAWTVFNLLNVWLGIWAYTSKIWLFSYTSHCIAKPIVQLYTNPLIFLVLFRRNTTTYGSEWKPGNCPRGRRDTSSRCKGQSYMKLNFKYIFSCSYRLFGNVFEAFWLFPYLRCCCCCCCFVCLLKYEKWGTCSSVCLPVWFVWLLVFPFAVPLLSQYNVLALRISTKKKMLQFWLNNL